MNKVKEYLELFELYKTINKQLDDSIYTLQKAVEELKEFPDSLQIGSAGDGNREYKPFSCRSKRWPTTEDLQSFLNDRFKTKLDLNKTWAMLTPIEQNGVKPPPPLQL